MKAIKPGPAHLCTHTPYQFSSVVRKPKGPEAHKKTNPISCSEASRGPKHVKKQIKKVLGTKTPYFPPLESANKKNNQLRMFWVRKHPTSLAWARRIQKKNKQPIKKVLGTKTPYFPSLESANTKKQPIKIDLGAKTSYFPPLGSTNTKTNSLIEF